MGDQHLPKREDPFLHLRSSRKPAFGLISRYGGLSGHAACGFALFASTRAL
jgi:hypothetical protein